jgi:hypothetical protein
MIPEFSGRICTDRVKGAAQVAPDLIKLSRGGAVEAVDRVRLLR